MKKLLTLLAICLPFLSLAGNRFTWNDQPWLGNLLSHQVAGVPTNTLLSGLVAYWAMEEASGADRVDYTNAYVLKNQVTVTREANHKGGTNAAGCLGVSFLTNANDAAFFVSTNWSGSIWVLFTNSPNSGDTVVARWGPNLAWMLWIQTVTGSNIVELMVADDGGVPTYFADSTVQLLQSNYYNVTWGVNTTNVWIRVDTEPRVTVAHGLVANNSDPLTVGGNTFIPTGNVAGTFVDEFPFWNRYLSDEDLADLWNNGVGLFYADFGNSGGGGSSIPFLTSDPSGSDDNAFTGDLGEEMVTGVVNTMQVTDMGVYIKSGSTHTHTLRIVDADDCITVTGTSVTLDFTGHSGWTYATLSSPISLTANHTYYLFCSYVIGEDHYYNTVTYTHTTDATIPQDAYYDGSCHTSGGGADHAYGPVNIKYVPVP